MALSPDGVIGSAIQRTAATRWFASVGPKVMPVIDRSVHRISGGRILVSRIMLPCAIVTTTGRKSGLARESPLASVPFEGDLYVVGSNFGKPHHPAWSWNMIDDPHVTVSYNGETYSATAQLLSAEEKARIWPRLIERWPLFDRYVERSGRDLRLFRLARD